MLKYNFSKKFKIGNNTISTKSKTFIIAEIGINHNGDLKVAKKLIDSASEAGFDAVKFQKRTVEKVYSKEFLDSHRESPWGKTQREQKLGLELSLEEYKEIDIYCKKLKIQQIPHKFHKYHPFPKNAIPVFKHLRRTGSP